MNCNSAIFKPVHGCLIFTYLDHHALQSGRPVTLAMIDLGKWAYCYNVTLTLWSLWKRDAPYDVKPGPYGRGTDLRQVSPLLSLIQRFWLSSSPPTTKCRENRDSIIFILKGSNSLNIEWNLYHAWFWTKLWPWRWSDITNTITSMVILSLFRRPIRF